MQIRTIGKLSIDAVLSQIVQRYETHFPGRIRACYLTGSYAEGNAVEWSDIDVYVLFKDAFVSEEEATQAEQLGFPALP
jgi:predicted nucleotidyltransferase